MEESYHLKEQLEKTSSETLFERTNNSKTSFDKDEKRPDESTWQCQVRSLKTLFIYFFFTCRLILRLLLLESCGLVNKIEEPMSSFSYH